MKKTIVSIVAIHVLFGYEPLMASNHIDYELREEMLESRWAAGQAVGAGAGIGCAVAVAATGIGAIFAPLAGIVCHSIANSTTQTIMNCTTDKGVRGRIGEDGSCVVIEVGIGLKF